MKVSLLNYIPSPAAEVLLLRTKNTRLKNEDDPSGWSSEKREEHLAYMRDTIKSSWEFLDYTFLVEDVTRAFTHQLVRTRTGSYAQESQRTVVVSGRGVLKPESVSAMGGEEEGFWDESVSVAQNSYIGLVESGIPAQDARGLLPTNTLTRIVAKFSLRALHEMAKVRLCTRTQGEYQNAFREMRALVVEVHPWVGRLGFVEVACAADGVCAFPRYGEKECPVWFPGLDRTAEKAIAKSRHDAIRYEAHPIAIEGKAQ